MMEMKEKAEASSTMVPSNEKGKEIITEQVTTSLMGQSAERNRSTSQLVSSLGNIGLEADISPNNVTRRSSEEHPLDPRRLRRLERNRLSSRRCQTKKELKQLELEEKCNNLSLELQRLPTVMEHYSDKRIQLKKENDELKENIANRRRELSYKQAKTANVNNELHYLRMLHISQLNIQQPWYQQKRNVIHQNQGNFADHFSFNNY
ncbi:uncharacterized protein [Typha latifolia]|uniref:uncharacterized protein n=1 Tax=Typha latifolia TaxID=4733 RepID=UPI003C30E956